MPGFRGPTKPKVRGISEVGHRKVDQSTSRRIDRDRDGVTDVDRIDIRAHECGNEAGEPPELLATPSALRARSKALRYANASVRSRPIMSVSVTIPITLPFEFITGT